MLFVCAIVPENLHLLHTGLESMNGADPSGRTGDWDRVSDVPWDFTSTESPTLSHAFVCTLTYLSSVGNQILSFFFSSFFLCHMDSKETGAQVKSASQLWIRQESGAKIIELANFSLRRKGPGLNMHTLAHTQDTTKRTFVGVCVFMTRFLFPTLT